MRIYWSILFKCSYPVWPSFQSIPSEMEFDPNSNPPCYKTMDEVSGQKLVRGPGEWATLREGIGLGVSECTVPSSPGHCDSAGRWDPLEDRGDPCGQEWHRESPDCLPAHTRPSCCILATQSSWGFCALLPGRRDGWAEGLGLRVRGELSACFGFISISPFLLQFAIGSLMDDYLGECQGCCLEEGCVGTGGEYGI